MIVGDQSLRSDPYPFVGHWRLMDYYPFTQLARKYRHNAFECLIALPSVECPGALIELDNDDEREYSGRIV
jgi:hypothetical protein